MPTITKILRITQQGPAGPAGADGADGADGATGATGAAGPGVPTGGTAGQVLEKINGTNFNTQWASKITAAGITSIDVTEDDELEIVKNGITYWMALYRRLVAMGFVAMVGDSITEQGATGLTQITGSGYWGFARAFNGAQWQPAVNGAVLEFASGGGTSALILATHIPQVLASGAGTAIIMAGTNDFPQGLTIAQTVANCQAMWAALQAAGIYLMHLAITPVALTHGQNLAGEYSADLVEREAAVRAAAEAAKVAYYNGNHLVEDPTQPTGSMILDPLNSNDSIHPNRRFASRYGRGLAAFIAARVEFTYDPTANTNWLTPNVANAGAAGQPTSWSTPYSPPDAGALTKALVDDDDGDWWEIEFNQGTATQQFAITNAAANLGGSPVGKVVESICEFQVMEGEVEVLLTQNVSGGTGTAYDLLGGGATPWADFNADDGVCRLLTPTATIGVGATLVYPSVTFRTAPNATARIRFRRCGCRQVV